MMVEKFAELFTGFQQNTLLMQKSVSMIIYSKSKTQRQMEMILFNILILIL